VDPLLRGLKVFIVISGIVLILGTTALIWLLVAKPSDGGDAAIALDNVTITELALPQGAHIVEMRLDGRTALLRLRDAADQEYLALVDAATGERRSLLRIVPDEK
jgi:hypothetical protein